MNFAASWTLRGSPAPIVDRPREIRSALLREGRHLAPRAFHQTGETALRFDPDRQCDGR